MIFLESFFKVFFAEAYLVDVPPLSTKVSLPRFILRALAGLTNWIQILKVFVWVAKNARLLGRMKKGSSLMATKVFDESLFKTRLFVK